MKRTRGSGGEVEGGIGRAVEGSMREERGNHGDRRKLLQGHRQFCV